MTRKNCHPEQARRAVSKDATTLIASNPAAAKTVLRLEARARRKALMLKLARMGADRIHLLMDPGPK